MKKVICVLLVFFLVLGTGTVGFAMNKDEFDQWLEEQIKISAEKEKQAYYNQFEEDIIEKYGEGYNEIYKQGWFHAFGYIKKEYDSKLQSAEEKARNEFF